MSHVPSVSSGDKSESSDAEIEELAAAGVRAVRFDLYRGDSEGSSELLQVGSRVSAVVGMHTELYVDAGDLRALEPTAAKLPRVSVDHLGMSGANRDVLLRRVDRKLRVEATGFGRVSVDVVKTLRAVHHADPGALMFGTDLPSTRADRPFAATDIDVVREALGDAAASAVLYGNGRAFYRMADPSVPRTSTR